MQQSFFVEGEIVCLFRIQPKEHGIFRFTLPNKYLNVVKVSLCRFTHAKATGILSN